MVSLPDMVPTADIRMYLVDTRGKVKLQLPVVDTEQTLSVSELPIGTYFAIFLRQNEILASKKLVILR